MQYFTIPDTFPTGQVRIADLPTTYTMVELNSDRHVIVNRNFEDNRNVESYQKWRTLLRFEKYVDSILDALKYTSIEQLKTED
jgi:hypothetical protein